MMDLKHFAPLVIMSVVTLAAGAASGFEITQPIPGTNQTACLDVPAGETASGTPVVAYPCKGGFNERWSFDAQGHLESIGAANGESKCLTFNNSGGGAILGSCDSTWSVFAEPKLGITGNIGINFINACLDSNGNYGSAAQVVVDGCLSSVPSRNWALRDIVITQPIPNTDQTACVDVSGNVIADGSPVTAYPCKLGGNERWAYVNGELQGVSSKGATTCLGWDQATNKVELRTCGGKNHTTWEMVNGAIINSAGGYVNFLDSQSQYGGVQALILTNCENLSPCSPSQDWSLR
jgi:hypothetical protein